MCIDDDDDDDEHNDDSSSEEQENELRVLNMENEEEMNTGSDKENLINIKFCCC